MRNARFAIVESTAEKLVIQDLGPWDVYPSVTNAAEEVVESLAAQLNGRRLFYYDSENQCDELLVKDGKFAGFKTGGE
jgi:hypothetical protein